MTESILHEDAKHWVEADLSTEIATDCEIQLLDFNNSKHIFWHSSSHMLGYAIELFYNNP
jgi:hypothetical protein